MRIVISLLCFGLTLTAQSAPDAGEGKKLFEAKCGVCHSEGAERHIGPGLKGAKEAKLPDGRNATHETLLKKIDNGGGGMPVLRDLLTEKEKESIIGYVLTL
jgi:mono/diheme cytochrome c family protein